MLEQSHQNQEVDDLQHECGGVEFHVLDADPRRVKRVRIVQDLRGERRKRSATAGQEEQAEHGA